MDDLELKVIGEIVRALSTEGLDDTQRRRIVQYATQRCIKPEPRVDTNQINAYLQQGSLFKGIG